MSTADCEANPGSKQTPLGIDCYIKTTSGNTPECNVPPASRYHLKITNHNGHCVGVKVECESVDGDVEFNGSSKEWEDSIFIKPGVTSPETETVDIDIQAAHSQKTSEDIRTKIKCYKIVISADPDIDETIEVNVN
ncbi:hypothetical protein [Halorubrum sp. Hd13]|uniref:hypothetical protein n=1 Tax=Halorubrum sp. Hd13 TaxID=1480728 RepID=UPI00113FEA3B|nr:hypothetical protein [Halorubrum sp. Hd13]